MPKRSNLPPVGPDSHEDDEYELRMGPYGYRLRRVQRHAPAQVSWRTVILVLYVIWLIDKHTMNMLS